MLSSGNKVVGSLRALPCLSGVTAAALIPRDADLQIEYEAFERQIEFLLSHGIRSFAINGATGEYTLTTADELRELLRAAKRVLERSANAESHCLMVGAGSPSAKGSRELCELAVEEGAHGILLPMPYFFPYAQDDLQSFVEAAAEGVTIPVYLYNLPSFTSPIEPETAWTLIRRLPNVVGIKDSSGSLDTLTLLTGHERTAGRILGNDGALHAALAAKVCDGVVSGVSCVLPELMLRAYAAFDRDAESAESQRLHAMLRELIQWLERFPVPWGLKIIAEARGLGAATFPFPLSEEKTKAREQFVAWFESRRQELLCEDGDRRDKESM